MFQRAVAFPKVIAKIVTLTFNLEVLPLDSIYHFSKTNITSRCNYYTWPNIKLRYKEHKACVQVLLEYVHKNKLDYSNVVSSKMALSMVWLHQINGIDMFVSCIKIKLNFVEFVKYVNYTQLRVHYMTEHM